MNRDEVWPGMPRAHHRALSNYLRALADDLGLRDWDITLDGALDEDDSNIASTRVTRDSRQAIVQLGDCFASRGRVEQRATLIHELLHCHFDAGFQYTCDATREVLGRPAFLVLEAGARSHVERTIDAIAVAIAPRFPLPPAPRR